MELLGLKIFEKDRNGRVEITELTQEEFRKRDRRLTITKEEYFNPDYYINWFKYIKPIFKKPSHPSAHICNITDILTD